MREPRDLLHTPDDFIKVHPLSGELDPPTNAGALETLWGILDGLTGDGRREGLDHPHVSKGFSKIPAAVWEREERRTAKAEARWSFMPPGIASSEV